MEQCKPIVDKRHRLKRKITDCPPWTVYGGRGQRPEVNMLSAYEFARHYRIQHAKRPYNLKEDLQAECHAELTDRGKQKVGSGVTTLDPGRDYVILESGGDSWLPLGHGSQVAPYRHDWVVVTRARPHVPVIFGAQSSRTTEEQAMRILVLFFPWVNDVADASPEVPFINDLLTPGMKDWTEVLLSHASRVGFPTLEVKHLVMNFVFTYCLPRETRFNDLEDNSDNESMADDLILDYHLDDNDLLEATRTHVRGSGAVKDAALEDSLAHAANREAADNTAPTKLYDMTMQMFELTGAIWSRPDDVGNQAAKERYQDTMQQAASCELNHDLARQAAKASRDSAKEDENIGLIAEAGAKMEAGKVARAWAGLF